MYGTFIFLSSLPVTLTIGTGCFLSDVGQVQGK